MIAILRALSGFIAAYGGLMVLAGLVGLGAGDATAGGYLLAGLVLGFLAGGLWLAAPRRETVLTRSQLLAATAMVWLCLSGLAAVPVQLATGASLVDSLFESVSALTTTGASVLPAPEKLPPSFVVARALTGWFGGALTLTALALVLGRVGAGGLGLAVEGTVRDREASRLPLERLIVSILSFYAAISALVLIGLALGDLPLVDSLTLAAGTVSVSGYLPRSAPLASYVGQGGQAFLLLAMLTATTSAIWHQMLVQRRWRQAALHLETQATLSVVMGLGLLTAFMVPSIPGIAAGIERAWAALFAALSLISTTGIETRPGIIAALPVGAVTLIVVVGGSSYSLTGGVKLFRVGAMGAQMIRELHRLVHPHSVDTLRLGSRIYGPDLMRAIWTLMAVWLIVFIAVAFLIAHAMPDFTSAYAAALAVIANAGPIYPSGFAEGAGWPAYADLTDAAKLVMIGAMIAGRLEILALVALVALPLWRR